MDCPKIFMEKQDHDSDEITSGQWLLLQLWTLSFLSQPRFNTRSLVVSHWGKE